MSERRDSEKPESEKRAAARRAAEKRVETESDSATATPAVPSGGTKSGDAAREIGGRSGPDPVRYGDWEKNGRCIDF